MEPLKKVCAVCQTVPCLCPDLADLIEEEAGDFEEDLAEALAVSPFNPWKHEGEGVDLG